MYSCMCICLALWFILIYASRQACYEYTEDITSHGHTELKISLFNTRIEIQSSTGHAQVIFYLST